MLDGIRIATEELRAARSRKGFALRAERRAAVELLRACIELALPMIAAEAKSILPYYKWGVASWVPVDTGRGLCIIDNTEHERWQVGHDAGETEHGWRVYVRHDGSLVEVFVKQWANRDASWVWCRECREMPRAIGLREAVRRYGGANLVQGLRDALVQAAKQHTEEAQQRITKAEKFNALIAALKK